MMQGTLSGAYASATSGAWPVPGGVIAGWLGFFLLCLFYGADVNLIVLLGASGALLAALCLVARNLIDDLRVQPAPHALVLLCLVGLVISYQFSLSKDSSYVATWVVALAPLGFLLGRGLGGHVSTLLLAIRLTVLVFAVLSCVRLVVAGEPARLPLSDPNNYATLLYLVLLPWQHAFFVSRAGGWRHDALHFGAFFVLMLALAGAEARAAAVVVAVAHLVWLGLAALGRVPWRRVVPCALLAVIAWVLAQQLLGVPAHAPVAYLDEGLGVRWVLIEAALDMYMDHPFTGIGLFAFPLLYRMQRGVDDQSTAGLFVHNDYVQLLVEGGLILAVVLVGVAGWTGVRTLRAMRAPAASRRFAELGFLLALGGALAHAAVTFVLYAPTVSLLLGLTAARVCSQTGAAAIEIPRRSAVWLLVGGLGFGWCAWLYLALDTAIAGALQNQPRVPFAASVRQDPERQLAFARTAQKLNGSRGVPVLAEALLLDQKLRANPGSDYLQQSVVAAYRRAAEVDPWNPLTYILLADLATAVPAVAGRLGPEQSPEALLLTTVSIDPLYVPGIDRLVQHFVAAGKPLTAHHLLRSRVHPRLVLLARLDPDAAERYRKFLLDGAKAQGDEAFAAELEALGARLQGIEPEVKTRWW